MMAALLAFLGPALAWLGTFLTGMFASWQTVFLITFLSFIGINLYNLFVEIVQELSSLVITNLSGVGVPGSPSLVASLVGVAGYLAIHLKLVEAFSFVVNIVLLKWIVVKIPFLKW